MAQIQPATTRIATNIRSFFILIVSVLPFYLILLLIMYERELVFNNNISIIIIGSNSSQP